MSLSQDAPFLNASNTRLFFGAARNNSSFDNLSITGAGCEPPPCTDNDGDGFAVEGGDACGPVDCNDENADAFPGQTETCTGEDNDCNGLADDVDDDGDGVNDCRADQCVGSVIPEQTVATKRLLPNHYAANVEGAQLGASCGCTCEEMLDILPGEKKGLYKHGCTRGIVRSFAEQFCPATAPVDPTSGILEGTPPGQGGEPVEADTSALSGCGSANAYGGGSADGSNALGGFLELMLFFLTAFGIRTLAVRPIAARVRRQ